MQRSKSNRRLENKETMLTTKKPPSRLARGIARANQLYKRDVVGLGARVKHTTTALVHRDFDKIQSNCPAHCAPLISFLKYIMLLILTYSIYDATMTTMGAPAEVVRKSMNAGASFITKTTMTMTQATAETTAIVSNSLLRSAVCAVPTFVFNPNAANNAKSAATRVALTPFSALDRKITTAVRDQGRGITTRNALAAVQAQLRGITGSSDMEEPDQLLITEHGDSFKEQVRDAANVMVSYIEKVTNPCYTLKQQAKRIQEVTIQKLQLDLEALLIDLKTIEVAGTVEVKEAVISACLRVALLLSAVKILSVISGTCTLCMKKRLELEDGPDIRGEDGNRLERLSFRMRKSRKASRKRRSAKKKSRKRKSVKRKASRKRRSVKRKVSRKRRSVKRKVSRKRRSVKRKVSRNRRSVKRKVSRKRRSVKRKVSRKRKSAKRKASRKRKSAKRKSRKRKSAKRKSRKRKSAKRKSRKRKSAKRKASRKRKSAKRKASRKRKRCPPGCVKRR